MRALQSKPQCAGDFGLNGSPVATQVLTLLMMGQVGSIVFGSIPNRTLPNGNTIVTSATTLPVTRVQISSLTRFPALKTLGIARL